MTSEASMPSGSHREIHEDPEDSAGSGTLVLRSWREPDGRLRVRLLSASGAEAPASVLVTDSPDSVLQAVEAWLKEQAGEDSSDARRAAGA
jgi:hypothetical protein